MFQRPACSKNFLVLVLPIALIWSWAGCTLLCGEITARHQKIATARAAHETCLDGSDADCCPLAATAAAMQARSVQPILPAATHNISDLPASPRLINAAVHPADVKQNSPPQTSSDPPLFLKHRNFRI